MQDEVPVSSKAEISAFDSLSVLFRFHGKAFDREGAARLHVSLEEPDAQSIVRMAKRQGLKARAVKCSPERLHLVPLPALARKKDGGYFILAKIADRRVLIQEPGKPPAGLSIEEIEAIWDGQLVLLTRRMSLGDLSQRFDFTWFIQAFFKYR